MLASLLTTYMLQELLHLTTRGESFDDEGETTSLRPVGDFIVIYCGRGNFLATTKINEKRHTNVDQGRERDLERTKEREKKKKGKACNEKAKNSFVQKTE